MRPSAHRRIFRALSLPLALLCLATGTQAGASSAGFGPLFLDGAASVGYDDNVNRGPGLGLDLPDWNASAWMSASATRGVSDHLQLAMSADAQVQAFARYERLDNARFSAEGRLRYRASGDLLEPTFALFVRPAATASASSSRGGLDLGSGVSVNVPLSESVTVDLAAESDSVAAASVVFSGVHQRYVFHLEDSLTERDSLFLVAQYLHGDTTVSGNASLEDPNHASVFTDLRDDAFSDRGLTTYRMEGQTRVAKLGYVRTTADGASLELALQWSRAAPVGGAPFLPSVPDGYVSRSVNATYAFHF